MILTVVVCILPYVSEQEVESKKSTLFPKVRALEKLTLFFSDIRDFFSCFVLWLENIAFLSAFIRMAGISSSVQSEIGPAFQVFISLGHTFSSLLASNLHSNLSVKQNYKAMNNFRDPDQVLPLPYVLSLSCRWDLGRFKHFWQELKYLCYKGVEEVWAVWGIFFFLSYFIFRVH